MCGPQPAGWVTATRVGDGALAGGHVLQHAGEETGGELLRRHRLAAHQHRGRVADAALELAHDPPRVGQRPALGGLTDQERPVRADVHGGGHRVGPLPERHQLDRAAARHTAAAEYVVPRSTPT